MHKSHQFITVYLPSEQLYKARNSCICHWCYPSLSFETFNRNATVLQTGASSSKGIFSSEVKQTDPVGCVVKKFRIQWF